MRFRSRILPLLSLASLVVCAGCSDDQAVSDEESTGQSGDQTAPEFDGLEIMSAVADNGLALSWSAASDDESAASDISYRVYLADASGGQDFSSPDAEISAGTTSTTLANLEYGATLYAVVRAVDAAGNEDSNQAERVANVGNLTAPDFGGALDIEVIDGQSLRVLWNPASDDQTASDEIRYAVFVSETMSGIDFDAAPTFISDPGAAQAVIEGLDDCVRYYVAVRALDEFDLQDDNNIVLSATTLDRTAPDFAGIGSVVTSGGGAALVWVPGHDDCVNGEELSYNIYLSTTSGGQNFDSPDVTNTSSPFGWSLSGLELSTEYFFVVRSLDPSGNEDDNEIELSGTTSNVADEQPPVFFGAILALGMSPSSISLAWDMASDDQSTPAEIIYDVYVSEESEGQDFGVAPAASSNPGETTIIIGSLVPEKQYYFVVRARDAAGNQDSNTLEVSATTFADDVPPIFDGIQQVVAVGPQTIEASWLPAQDDGSKPAEITYEVYLATASASFDYDSPVQVIPDGQTFAVLTDLDPSTEYFVSARAIDKRDNKETNTIEAEGTTWDDIIAPTFTSDISTSPIDLTDIFVDWADATDDIDLGNELRYEVFYALTPGGFNFASPDLSPAVGITEGTLTGLYPGTPHYITVRAYDEADNSSDSNEALQATNADIDPPAFDGAFQITGASANSLSASWADAIDNYSVPANITYTMCISSNPANCIGANFAANASATVTGQSSYTFDNNLPINHGILVSTTYFIAVRAEDEFGNNETNSVLIQGSTVPDSTAPTWDEGTSNIQASAINEGQVDLTWSAASDDVTTDPSNIAYDIYWAAGGPPSFGSPNATVIGSTSTSVTGLNASTSYNFSVRARDLAGNRTQNIDSANAVTPADNTAPSGGEVNNLSATGCTQILIQWDEANDLGTALANMNYDICVGDLASCGGTAFSTTTTVVGTTSTTINVSSAGTYYVKVRARDTSNNSNTNNTSLNVNTGTQDAGDPTEPPTLSLTTDTSAPDLINLDWTGSTDTCYAANTLDYEICYSTSAAGCQASNWATNTTVTNTGGVAITVDDLFLAQNTFYYVGVRAVDDQANFSTPVRKSTTTPVSWVVSGLENKLASDCAGCHDAPSPDPGWSHAEMVGIDSGCGGQEFVDTFNPSASFVYLRLATTALACGVGQMPNGCAGNSSCWNSTWTDTLYDWIQQGAVDNN